MDVSRLDLATDPGRFSPREVVAHLADWEPVFLERMKSALSNPMGRIEAYDEGQWAIDHDYASSDVHVQADLYLARRQETVQWLNALYPDQWKLQFEHPERGPLSVEDTANMMLGHDLYHIRQLTEIGLDKVAGTW